MTEDLHGLANEIDEVITTARSRDYDASPEEAEIVVQRRRKRRQQMTDAEARAEALLIEQEVRGALAKLFEEGQPANQGNNGIVYKVSERDVGAVSADALQAGGFLDTESAAAKVLKIYNPGEGVQEFQMQQKAHAALERFRAEHPDTPCAFIPRALQMRDYEFDETTIASLNESGARLHGKRAETLFMDFIPAKDFARIVYEEVLARSDPALLELYQKRSDESIEEYAHGNRDMGQLQFIVGRLLKLEDPETRAQDGALMLDQAIANSNSTKIFGFLAARGYKIHPKLADQLATTVRVLHDAGIHHNDVHERNIMITGDPTDERAQLYLIDFGAAREKASGMESFRSDEGLANILREMQETKEDRYTREELVALKTVADELNGYVRRPAALALRDQLKRLISAGAESTVDALIGTGALQQTMEGLAGLKLLVDENVVTAADADALVRSSLVRLKQRYELENARLKNKKDRWASNRQLLTLCRMLYVTLSRTVA